MATNIETTPRSQRVKELPKQIQQVCKDLALARYERHYHPRHRHHRKHVIADAILGAAVFVLVLFSAYIFFFYRGALLREGIEFSIRADQTTVQSGEKLDYLLTIENFTGSRLLDASIEFPPQSSFIVSSVAAPLRLEGNSVRLGSLNKEEIKEIRVSGYVLAGVGETIRLSATMHYDAGPLSGTGEKLTSESLQVAGSSLDMTLELPETIVANQPFPYAIRYQNQSPVTKFDTVSILPNWPPGFEILSSSVALDQATDFWTLPSIGSLEQGKIEGEARLITADLEEAEFSLRMFAAPQGLPLLQEQVKLMIPIRYPNVSIYAAADAATVSLGREITYSIELENEEVFSLHDVQAVLNVNTAVFDAASLPESRQASGNVVIDLAQTLDAAQTASRQITLRLKSQINPRLAFGDGEAVVRLPLSVSYTDGHEQNVVIPVQAVRTPINSDLAAQAFSRYYSAEGDQIGRGPLPPRVGETTKYWVFVHLTNQLHVLNDVVMTATLPTGVDWTGRKSMTEGRSLDYALATRLVRWELDSMADYKTDFARANYGIAFEVAVTPMADQAGDVLLLLEQIEVQGRDAVTGEILSVRPADVTSELQSDSYASGDGKVLP